MALPDYFGLVAGTPLSWLASGGTYALTATSLANGAVRAGDKSGTLVDGTLGMPKVLGFRLESQVASAVTSTPLMLYIGASENATASSENPAQLTGSDATVTSGSELLAQLDFVGSLVFSNAIGTTVQKRTGLLYFPVLPYIIPVLYNNTGQALGSTAGNHVLIMTPYYQRIAE